MLVEVVRAPTNEKARLHNLLQLYLHDMTEFTPATVDSEGIFQYKPFDAYWTEPDRYPFFIRVDGSLAGFALIRLDEGGRIDMSEFFVMRGYRRRGVGSMAAKRLFDLFPGDWQVRQEPANTGAQRFWRNVIAPYTGGDFQDLILDNRWKGPTQRFRSGGAPTSTVHSAKEA